MNRSVAWVAVARWITFVGALIAFALGTSASPSAAAGPAIWVSPSGADANSGTQRAPVQTIAEAWRRVFRQGGTIILLAGVYTGNGYLQLRGRPGGHVMIEAAPQARPAITDQVSLWGVRDLTMKNIHFASPGRGLTGDWPLAVDGCSSNVTIAGGSGLRFAVVQAYNTRFEGGSWGGYQTDGDQDSMFTSDPTRCDTAGQPRTHGIVLDGVTIHDVFWGISSARLANSHPDCLQATGPVRDLTIKNSRFLRCSNSFLMFPTDAMGSAGLYNVTIEHNVFRDLGDSFFGIQIYDGTADQGSAVCANVVFRGNLYEPGRHAVTGVNYAPLRIACRGRGHARIVDNTLKMRNYDRLVQVTSGTALGHHLATKHLVGHRLGDATCLIDRGGRQPCWAPQPRAEQTILPPPDGGETPHPPNRPIVTSCQRAAQEPSGCAC